MDDPIPTLRAIAATDTTDEILVLLPLREAARLALYLDRCAGPEIQEAARRLTRAGCESG
jgi:hypothetical protein